MARINTNVSSMIAQTNYKRNQASLDQSLQRLSSGYRINSGGDDPAGLIASESLRSEMKGLTQAVDNSTRAKNVIATAEGALSEVSNLLLSIKSLIVSAANTGAMSADEVDANQLQIDSAIQSITRISNSTTFAGLNLLDGSLGYITSGMNSNMLHDVQIHSAQFGTNDNMPVTVEVITSAQQAALSFPTSSITQTISLEVSGNEGVQVLSFTSGTNASAIAYAVNRLADSTGIHAGLINSANASSGITFSSTGYGSSQFVSVQVIGSNAGNFATIDSTGAQKLRSTGRDAVANINGAQAIANGLNLSVNTAALQMSMNIDQTMGLGTQQFVITGGGAMFQLGGQVKTNQQVNIGIISVSASRLGNAQFGYLTDIVSGGTASLSSGSVSTASSIVDEAINQISVMRGRLGAFESNIIDTNINSLNVALENVTASESSIRDTDFAEETSNMTRNQILVQAGTSVLQQANSTAQNVLSLLKG